MKIALLRPLPDPARWSMDLYLQELMRSLGPLMKDGRLILFPSESDFASWQTDLSRKNGKRRRYWQQYVEYGTRLRHLKADLFHITDHGYAHLIPFLRNRKVIVTFHDALLPNLDEGRLPVRTRPAKAIWAQRYSLHCMRRAAGIIAVSEFSKKEFLKYCSVPDERVAVVHEGVSEIFYQKVSEEARLAFRKRWELGNKPVILLTGRVDPHKNVEGALETVYQLRTQHHLEAMILKIGSLFSEGQRELIRQFNLSSCVRETGSLPFSEIPLAYQASEVLLFLSWYEGFGFPALEAMASGIPAIVSNRGSLPEVAGDGARVLDPANLDRVSESVLEILTDGQRRLDLIAKGKKRAAQFTWKQTAAKTLEVYAHALEERHATIA